MTKIGMMSFAHMHACSYAACVNQLADAELTAIWDDDAARGQSMAKQYKTTFMADMKKFLASDIEGVIICSENVKHRAMTEAAAKAGKWVLCEKPLATTVDDAKAMVAACKKAKVGLGTAFPCRYAPTLIELKDRVARGELGEIYAASTTNNGSYPGGWFADDALSGGGATMDHTVHVVDVLRWLTGKEFTKAYCENGRLIHKNIHTDDVGSVHLEMDGGLIVSHIASWNRSKSFPTWGDVTLELIGEKGVIEVDAFNQKINVYSDKQMKAEWANWGGNMDLGLVQDFVAAVRERRDPPVTGLDGLRAVEVTVAAYRSVQTGKMVRVAS
ncbi:MAG: Gfo/Idh/MocA family oxidoreductase [Candidatus Hydrogenedentes bacterium]|nr:Gfo/Idh/MocA family oxidoreductase [Candidatus Hydrogenedentota bacterium]